MMPSRLLFLLFLFLSLPLAIWLSLVFAGLAVSDCGLSLLQFYVSELLGEQFSLGGIWVWSTMAQEQLWVHLETGRILSQAAPPFLCPEGSKAGPSEQKWWSYLYSQACQHSWETSSLQAFGYGALWLRISSGYRGTGSVQDAGGNPVRYISWSQTFLSGPIFSL